MKSKTFILLVIHLFWLFGWVFAVKVAPIFAGGSFEDRYPGVYNGEGNVGEPPTLAHAATATDNFGRLLIYGGIGYINSTVEVPCADLWRFDGESWTLLYTTQWDVSKLSSPIGVFDHDNNPGGRYATAMAVGSDGVIWIYGGLGLGLDTKNGTLPELWAFDGVDWACFSKEDTDYLGKYTDQGVPSTSSSPPGKYFHSMWIDSDLNVWHFGGLNSANDYLNDIWYFNKGKWTWVRGEVDIMSNIEGDIKLHTPGSRHSFSYSYSEKYGLFIYGGRGKVGVGSYTDLNELWNYNGTFWTLLSGNVTPSVEMNPRYTYPLGEPCGNCTPGRRLRSAMSMGLEGTIYVGFGIYAAQYHLRDIWQYKNDNWTWVAGYEPTDNVTGNYTLGIGVVDSDEKMFPRGRHSQGYWSDENGNLWIYGGTDDEKTIKYADMWVFYGCDGVANVGASFRKDVESETLICGFASNISSECGSFEKARNLAYICNSPVCFLDRNVSVLKTGMTFLADHDLELRSASIEKPTILDFTKNINSSVLLDIEIGTGTLKFSGFDFRLNASIHAMNVHNSKIMIQNSSFTMNGTNSANIFTNIFTFDGSNTELAIVNCSLIDISLIGYQYLFRESEGSFHHELIYISNSFASPYGGFFMGYNLQMISFRDMSVNNFMNTLVHLSTDSFGEMDQIMLRKISGTSALFKIKDKTIAHFKDIDMITGSQFLEVTESSNVTVSASKFQDMIGISGTVLNIELSEAIINATEFKSIEASGRGGVMKVVTSTVILTNSTFEKVSAADGGILYAEYLSEIDINDVTITEVTSHDGGIAALFASSTINIVNTTINNVTATSGGVLNLDNKGKANLVDVTATDIVVSSAGLMYATFNSNGTFENVLIENCEASNLAGAMYVDSTSSSVSYYGVYRKTSSQSNGGVIVCEGFFSSFADTFEDVLAAEYGGAIYIDGGFLKLTDSSITQGVAGSGGAIYSTGSYKIEMQNADLANNIASTSGGGAVVFLDSGTVSLTEISFIKNRAMGDGIGGAMILEQATGSSVVDCEFHENEAAYGGAIFLASSVDNAIDNCTFFGNKANYSGGAVFMMSNIADLNSSTFEANVALNGAKYSTAARTIETVEEVYVNSGKLDLNLNISIHDIYGNPVSDPMERRVGIGSAFLLIGSLNEAVLNGKAYFSQSGVIQYPGSIGFLQIQLTEFLVYGGYRPSSFAPSINVTLKVLSCSEFETVAHQICSACTSGQYVTADTHECASCPAHAYCNGTHMVAAEGYWGVFAYKDIELYECPLEGACPGGFDYFKCNDGYEGVVCAICDEDYGPVGKTCAACGNIAIHAISLPIVTVIVVLILLAMVLFLSMRSGGDSAGTKILFNYCQTVAILAGLITLRKQQLGSSEALGIFSAFTLDLNVISIKCLFSLDYYDILWVLSGMTLVIVVVPWLVWLPMFLVGMIMSCFGVLQLFGEGNVKKYGKIALQSGISFMRFSNRYRNMLFIILYSLLLPRVAGHIMSLFSCVEIEDTWYLSSDFSIVCRNSTYYYVMAYAILLFALFVVGSLLFLFIGMLLHRIASWQIGKLHSQDGLKDAQEEEEKSWLSAKLAGMSIYSPVQLKKDELSNDQKAILLHDSAKAGNMNPVLKYAIQAITFLELESAVLYFQRGYKASRFFWEIVVSIRKILILSAVVFSSDVVLKGLVILFILVIFSIFQVITWPFKRRIDNIAEFISLLALIWVTVVVELHELYATDPENYTRDVLIVFVLISSIVVPTGAMILYSLLFSDRRLSIGLPHSEKDSKSDRNEESGDSGDEMLAMNHSDGANESVGNEELPEGIVASLTDGVPKL